MEIYNVYKTKEDFRNIQIENTNPDIRHNLINNIHHTSLPTVRKIFKKGIPIGQNVIINNLF